MKSQMLAAASALALLSHLSLAGETPHKPMELSALPERDANAIRDLAAKFRDAVNGRSMAELQALHHPDLLQSLSTNQLAYFQRIYLVARLAHPVAQNYSLRFVKLNGEDIRQLEDQWKAQWRFAPEMLVELDLPGPPGGTTTLPLFIARKEHQWYLVAPIPPYPALEYQKSRKTGEQNQAGSNQASQSAFFGAREK